MKNRLQSIIYAAAGAVKRTTRKAEGMDLSMKFIDEKGRLFGKLSIIDLLVLILIIAAAVFVGTKLADRNDTGEVDNSTRLEYTVLATEVDPSTYEVVKQYVDSASGLKDQMMTGSTLCDGYVIDVVATPHVTYVECDDGTVKRVESSGDDTRLDLLFTCVATVSSPVTNSLGSQEIRAGIPHILKTTHFEFQDAKILSVTWLEEDE